MLDDLGNRILGLGMISLGVRVFVLLVFVVLGATFVVTTAALYLEFKDQDWFALAAMYSHLFIFFPTFGLLALCAFYVPAAVFTDFYWFHVPYGRARFLIGFAVVVVLSLGLSRQILAGDVPALFSLSPETIRSDTGSPARCDVTAGQCRRVGVMDAVEAVRLVSQRRLGLSPFVRECTPDPFVEAAPDATAKRFCFPTRTQLTAPDCCKAQEKFNADLARLFAEEQSHSVTDRVHTVLLPFKAFFLLVLLVIGIMLAVWRREIDRQYGAYARRIERGVIIGAVAMMLWPLMNHAFLQAESVLYGTLNESMYVKLSPVFSLLFGCWSLLIVLFFFRQHERDVEAAGKIAGGIASAVAVIKYNQIIDYSVRLFGAGADKREMIGLGLLLALAFVALFWVQGSNERTPLAARPAKPPEAA